jgi:hypothetical protein
MKLPKTLKGKFIYYHDVPKTYAKYKNDPKFAHLLVRLYKDLEEGEWDASYKRNEYSNNHNFTDDKSIVNTNVYSRTLKGSGVTVNDYDKTYSIPEGYKYNNKTKQALIKLRQDGYKRSNNTSRSS